MFTSNSLRCGTAPSEDETLTSSDKGNLGAGTRSQISRACVPNGALDFRHLGARIYYPLSLFLSLANSTPRVQTCNSP